MRTLLERRLELAKLRTRRTKVVQLKDDGEGFVFTKKNGVPIVSFRKRWHAACRAAGIPDRVVTKTVDGKKLEKRYPGRIFHDFRRTAVRRLERAGVSRSTAMAMVGMKTDSIYRRYAIVSEGDLREAARKLDAMAP